MSHSAGIEVAYLLWTHKIYTCVHETLLLDHVGIHVNLVHVLMPHLLCISFSSMIPFIPRSSRVLPSLHVFFTVMPHISVDTKMCLSIWHLQAMRTIAKHLTVIRSICVQV